MDVDPVREAYARLAPQYVDLCGGDCRPEEQDVAFVARHLAGLAGPVLDLGCGPGQWSGYLHGLGVDVTGVDLVPEFLDHAREHHPGPDFRLGSMTDRVAPDGSAVGVLSWYSTIHVPPPDLDGVLAGFRRLLVPSGVLVLGFFDSEDEVAPFDHAVTTAWRWPVDLLAQRLAEAGFREVERLQQQLPERPDRKYAALAARAC